MVDGKVIGIGSLLIMFIGVIVVLAIMPEIATNQEEMTNKNSVVSELVDISTTRNLSGTEFPLNFSVDIRITEYPTGWKVSQCPVSSFVITNQSGTVLVDATDYELDESTGILNFYDTHETNMSGDSNTTYATYDYCLDGYITSTAGRSVAKLILIFTALALVAFTIFYSVKHWF